MYVNVNLGHSLRILITMSSMTVMSACAYEPPSVGGSNSGGSGGSAEMGGAGGGNSGSSGSGGNDALCASGEVCVPAAPEPWSGPYRARSGPTGQFKDLCPDGTSVIRGGYFGNQQLLPCSCDCECSGQACTIPQVKCWDEATCAAGTGIGMEVGLKDQDMCAVIPSNTGGLTAGSCQVTLPSTVIPASTCAATNPKLPVTPPFNAQMQVCELTTTTRCGAGACTTASEGGYPKIACVTQSGEHSCPSDFPNQQIIYEGWDEGRTCGACSADPTAVHCSEPVINMASDNCATVVGPVTQNCSATLDAKAIKYQPPVATMKIGACKAQTTGTITGSNPFTICCRDL